MKTFLFIFIYIITYIFIYIHYNKTHKWFILVNKNYISIICFFLIAFSKIFNEYITNLITPEGHSFKILYDLSVTEEYKQEQILHSNFDILFPILLAPICEEFLFRWILLKKMLNYGISGTKSICFSSFLFGFSHLNPWQCITAFLIGSFIGMIYLRTKELFFCILSHALSNIITVLLYKISSKNRNITYLWESAFFPFIGLYLTLHLFISQTTSLCKICQNSSIV